ncbi:MAG: sugar transferase [Planctomycetaceae bacterium]|jgi:lipopolysaccharide/colanic/teichoic acid biosynthesis glycosyltransferase|nr:sugar transferase [Planctomycetaceae bacterium]
MILKRLFDIFASFFGLIGLLPLFIFVAAWVKFDSRGPVFYRPERGGRYGKPFRIYKFRSMIVDADKKGPTSTANDDNRITRSNREFKMSFQTEFSDFTTYFDKMFIILYFQNGVDVNNV